MTINTAQFSGFPGGMNVAAPSQEISDAQARYLQDVLVNKPGMTIRRGPVEAVPNVAVPASKIVGTCSTQDPAGNTRVAVILTNGTTSYFSVLTADLTGTAVSIPFPYTIPAAPYPLVDIKAALGGGVWVGVSQQADLSAGANQSLFLWRGGMNALYSTGTATYTIGNKIVTGSGTTWGANVSPGMFLWTGAALLGVVKSVDSNTQLTLEAPAQWGGTATAYSMTSLRGFGKQVMTGRLTCQTTTTAVTGTATKFSSQGLATGTWQLLRASDGALVGTVASVQNDLGLTLSGNAAVNMQNERYLAVCNTTDYSNLIPAKAATATVGYLNAVYAGVQWFASAALTATGTGDYHSRVWFSDSLNGDAVDLSPQDGNFINIVSSKGINTPIKALVPAYNSLLVLKDNEAFVIVGGSPATFQERKLHDDGVWSGMSAVQYNGSALWAGRNGIYLYDGTKVENIVEETLGEYYRTMISSVDPKTYRMWGTIYKDHYLLHIESCAPYAAPIKGNTTSPITRVTIAIYLPTRAVTLFTNVNLRGAVVVNNDTWYAVNTSANGVLCKAASLFEKDGNDTVTCDGGTPGPDFYVETKKYDLGDGTRKKLWKELVMGYQVVGDTLKTDTVPGLNIIGYTTSTPWPATTTTWDALGALGFSAWSLLGGSGGAYPNWDTTVDTVLLTKRIKFLKRDQHLAFRLYQTSAAVTKVKIARFALGYKLMREGRV